MDRIALEEIGIHPGIAEVVDSHNLDILRAALGDGAQDEAADAAEAVDGKTNGHALSPILDDFCCPTF